MISVTEQVINTICRVCHGGSCVLKVHIQDGVVTRIETDDGEELQLRPCPKGRARRQQMYSPNRLKYPMKRVGERGEGKFERTSWDEALNSVGSELKRVYKTYGASAVLTAGGPGDMGRLGSPVPLRRLLSLMGGFSITWGNPSFEGATFASLATYGTTLATNTPDDLLNSKLIILWGLDIARTNISNIRYHLAQAREKGVRIVSIDPRYTDSTATFAHQWIPIRPGTDTAMSLAMAYVMITDNLQNQSFLDTYTIGFECFKDYVLGIEDGVSKTSAWAEAITGVSVEVIASLAREYATTRPAALMPGWGPGRTAYGEQFHRAVMVLAAMGGNIGLPGGNSGVGSYGQSYRFSLGQGLPVIANPLEQAAAYRRNTFLPGSEYPSAAVVHSSRIWDAILEGKAGGYPADYKMLFVINSNPLNQRLNLNKGVKALKSLEFIMVQEQFLSATARFADILLPVTYLTERQDVVTIGGNPSYGFQNKANEPYYETKSQLEIASALAERMGVANFNDKTEEELLQEIVANSKDIPDYDSLKKDAIYRVKLSEPGVAFKEQIEDPQNNPFRTPSGKIEIYSQQIADMNDPMLPPIPKYIETWENLNDPLAEKYPLQLITNHPKLRVHSQFYNVPWLTELEPQAVIMNTSDAEARNIKDGDQVRVFNDRGETIIPARVTQRIMPGVVDIPEGSWYSPSEHGIDHGGCPNILTRDEVSPAGAFTSNTCLVRVQKA